MKKLVCSTSGRKNQMHDVYVMNRNTGEIVPSQQAIREYYKTHGIFDDWTDEWKETDLEVEDSFIEYPDFRNTLNL